MERRYNEWCVECGKATHGALRCWEHEPTKEEIDAILSVYRMENAGRLNVINMARAAYQVRGGFFQKSNEAAN